MIRTAALAGCFIAASLSVIAAEETTANLDLAKARTTAESICSACHGTNGNSLQPAYPILAGQGMPYLYKQLTEFKATEGKPSVRNNAVMAGMTAALTLEDMKGLAVYFSQQIPKLSAAKDEKLVAAGRELWRKGDFEKGIPACAGCHGPTGAGIPAQYPRLSGQYAEYTETQLKSFRNEERSNDQGKVMRTISDKLSDKQIRAVADYIAGLR